MEAPRLVRRPANLSRRQNPGKGDRPLTDLSCRDPVRPRTGCIVDVLGFKIALVGATARAQIGRDRLMLTQGKRANLEALPSLLSAMVRHREPRESERGSFSHSLLLSLR
jgi:hypothetical protein